MSKQLNDCGGLKADILSEKEYNELIAQDKESSNNKVSFDDALKIARKLKKNIDGCDEYDKGYMFKSSADELTIGGEGACCVLKDTGKAVNQTEFYDTYKPQFIKSIEI